MENNNTQNKARRFKVVITDLREDKVLMDVTTNAAIVTTASPFDNLANEDRDGYTQGAHYFNSKAQDILHCAQSTIEGISKLMAENKELGLMFNIWLMAKQAEQSNHSEDEEEDEDNE